MHLLELSQGGSDDFCLRCDKTSKQLGCTFGRTVIKLADKISSQRLYWVEYFEHDGGIMKEVAELSGRTDDISDLISDSECGPAS